MNFKTTLLGATAAVALSAAAASAATMQLSFGDDGGTFDVLNAGGFTFDEDFADGTAGGALAFTFENTTASDIAVTLSAATITQNGFASFFGGGASVSWTSAGVVASAAQGVTGGGNLTFNLGAGASDTLNVSYGAATSLGIDPNIDFTVIAQVAAVPLPAAGFLLLGGLGGLAAMRRKTKKAAA